MFRELFKKSTWNRIYTERLGEPVIYNLVSVFVFLFGNIVQKIKYDCVRFQQYAFGLNWAFKFVVSHGERLGVKRLVFIELGIVFHQGRKLFQLDNPYLGYKIVE